MIIGSDVTEFVTKYHSFIRTGAESNPGIGMMRGSAQVECLICDPDGLLENRFRAFGPK